MHRISRSLRLVLAGGALAYAMAAAPALAADLSYWYAGAQVKVFPTTVAPLSAGKASAPSATPLSLSAARSEYEGRQLVLRPNAAVRDVWIQPSDLIARDASGSVIGTIAGSEAETFKVHYVTVRYPSYGYRLRGPQPDALIPMTLANGQRLGWRPGTAPNLDWRAVAANTTQPFYVLFHVPEGTAAGVYRGSLRVSAVDGAGQPLSFEIPVEMRVYPFSIAAKTLKTSFGLDVKWAKHAASASHQWLLPAQVGPDAARISESTDFKADQLGGWFEYFAKHRISPQTLYPMWSSGMYSRDAYMHDYLGTGAATTREGERFGFNAVRVPEYFPPAYIKNPFASSAYTRAAATYYRRVKAELYPYAARAFAYPIDEPAGRQRAFVERYAAFVHRYAPGMKFLVTADASRMDYRPLRGVDIYVQKLHFYYRDYRRWVAPIRRAGKAFWLYTHAGEYQAQAPNYLVDGRLSDPRAHGWFVYHTNTSGLLYFNVNAWRPQMRSSTYRDPYLDPLSYRSTLRGRAFYANGDGSLVYPGYYPRLGLLVEGAPPVGSLRMEAVRDGIEDYEYAKLLEKRIGRTGTMSYIKRVVGAPRTVVSAGRATFPAFPSGAGTYMTTRDLMAQRLSQ